MSLTWGSSPLSAPFKLAKANFLLIIYVAQLDRASDFGSEVGGSSPLGVLIKARNFLAYYLLIFLYLETMKYQSYYSLFCLLTN